MRIGNNLSLEEVDRKSIPEIVRINRNNWIANEMWLNEVEEEYLATILSSGDFVFGYLLRYKTEPAVFILFIRQREGVLAVLEFGVDRSYPFILAATAKTIGAELICRAAQLGYRKLEAVVYKANATSLKNASILGAFQYSTMGSMAFFELYLPSILCISNVKNRGKRDGAYFDLKKDFFRIIRSYTKTLEVSESHCAFEIYNQGICHSFLIDRICEACTSLKKDGEFALSCTPSAQFARPSEPVEIRLSIENLSDRSKTMSACLALDGSDNLFKNSPASIRPGERITLVATVVVDRPGIYHGRCQCQLDNTLINLATAFRIAPPLETDFSGNTFLFRAGSRMKLDLRISNRCTRARTCNLAISGPKKADIHPAGKTLVVKAQSSEEVDVTLQADRSGLISLRCALDYAPTGGKVSELKNRINVRATRGRGGCVGNIIDDVAIINNDQLSVAVNLRTGFIYMRPFKPNLFDVYHPWDEMGPPFTEFMGNQLPTNFSSMPWHDHSDIAFMRSTWRNRKLSVKITKNRADEAAIELTDSSDDVIISKVISLRSDSVVRFQSRVTFRKGSLAHSPSVKVKPSYCCAKGTILSLPVDGKDPPLSIDPLHNKYEASKILREGSRLSEKWVCYTIKDLGYSFGLFWEGEPMIDFLHIWYMKLPWLEFRYDEPLSGTYVFPPYYFWAGNGDWKKVRQLSNEI